MIERYSLLQGQHDNSSLVRSGKAPTEAFLIVDDELVPGEVRNNSDQRLRLAAFITPQYIVVATRDSRSVLVSCNDDPDVV